MDIRIFFATVVVMILIYVTLKFSKQYFAKYKITKNRIQLAKLSILPIALYPAIYLLYMGLRASHITKFNGGYAYAVVVSVFSYFAITSTVLFIIYAAEINLDRINRWRKR